MEHVAYVGDIKISTTVSTEKIKSSHSSSHCVF
jgi:hypothetical protein